ARVMEKHSLRWIERACGDRTGDEHHELARRRKDRIEGHQAEDGVDAVVRDGVGDAVGDARDDHEGESIDPSETRMRDVSRRLIENDDGWDFKVLVVGGEWVIRVPRGELA